MPGYLMNMMVLIETDNWLGQIVDTLSRRDKKSDVENKVLALASQARQYLHFDYDPGIVTENFPPVSPAQIDNNIGSGITQWAFMGAIGPDFPAAANILALNQSWVAQTMHIGAPRRALKLAGTTTFVKNCISNQKIGSTLKAVEKSKAAETSDPSLQVVGQYKKLVMAYALGHLSSIATHVLVEPFINQWAWSQDNANRSQFVVQLDAQIAKGYFQRDHLHKGQTWTAYFPDNDKGLKVLCELYSEVFADTYGEAPREALCRFPKYEAINTQFPKIDDLATKNEALRKALEIYPGYPKFLKESAVEPKETEPAKPGHEVITAQGVAWEGGPRPADPKELTPAQKALDKQIDSIDGLQSFLKYDFECKTPDADNDFLLDGYKNTRNWALDAGYDHAPWVFSTIMSAAILWLSLDFTDFLQWGVTKNVWDNISNFSVPWPLNAIFVADFEKNEVAEITASNLKSWQADGMFGNEKMWHGIFAQSYSACGPVLWLFNAVLSGIQFIKQIPVIGPLSNTFLGDGIFGQNTDSWDQWRTSKYAYMLWNTLNSPTVSPPLPGTWDVLAAAFPKVFHTAILRWPILFLGNVLADGYEVHFVNHENTERGIEGDRLGLQLWHLRLWMASAYALSSIVVFGVKAADDPRDDTHLHTRDYLLGLIFPLMLIAYKVWYKSGFEGELLKSITGVDWPSTDTDKVDTTILPVVTDGTGRKVFSTTAAQKLQVRVFADGDKDVMKATSLGDSPNKYYPQDEAEGIPWDDIPKRDDQERARKSKSTVQTYTLNEILERAKFFSGILAMAAVNYDNASDKQCVNQIFKDWNLNLRTDEEWNDLMETKADGTPGLLKAAQQWWEAIAKGTPPDPSAVVQMEIATCLKAGPAQITGRIEDRTVAPNNTRDDTAHIFLGRKDYKILDGSGKVVATGTTDETGGFSQTLPGPGDYELLVDGYKGL